MISIERCREILGRKAESLDDIFLHDLLAELYFLGQVIVEKATAELSKKEVTTSADNSE